jgi:Trk K+ transport system NAD-binding subunit
MHIRVLLSKYRSYTECPSSRGARLKTEALLWRVGSKALADQALPAAQRFLPVGVDWTRAQLEALPGLSLHDLMQLPIQRLRDFVDGLQLPSTMLDEALKLLLDEVRSRQIHRAAANTLEVAAFAAGLATLFGTAAALALSRAAGRVARVADAFFLSPLVLPGLAFGLAALMYFTLLGFRPSIGMLVAGHLIVVAPFVLRTVGASLSQLDPALLEEAGISEADAILALTDDDKTNLLISNLAKRAGAKRALALINAPELASLATDMRVDTVLDPRALTVSQVLLRMRRGRILGLQSLEDGMAEVAEGVTLESSSLIGKGIGYDDLPEGVTAAAILRGDQIIMADSDVVVRTEDHLVIFYEAEMVRSVEKFFRVNPDYF